MFCTKPPQEISAVRSPTNVLFINFVKNYKFALKYTITSLLHVYLYLTKVIFYVKTLGKIFSSSKCSLFHNSNVFGSCIIHILYTGVLKFNK